MIDAEIERDKIGVVAVDHAFRFLGCNERARNYFPQFNELIIDEKFPQKDGICGRFYEWMEEIERVKAPREYTVEEGGCVLRITGDYLWEGGSVLELHTYQLERKDADDCRVGVHLDWDGVVHEMLGEDVINEVDVLTLKGNIPTFISCKSGKMTPQQSLHALYELDAVTKRFGGKYAKKVLVTANDLGAIYLERAKEMGIEVR